MTILIQGLGFVGLTTALGLAGKGFGVAGYDTNAQQIEKISSGEVPFLEPGLPDALKRNLGGNFNVLRSIDEADVNPDIVFICVGTPCGESGKADLIHVKSAIDSISAKMAENSLLVIKSTIPPGTTQKEIAPYVRAGGFRGSIAVNPEFLREGHCWEDFTKPDRIICGIEAGDENAMLKLNEIYQCFNVPIHFVNYNTAEFTKYLSNSLLASLISFSNEMAAIAEAAGDVAIGDAFRMLHEDCRIAGSGIAHYIYPGCGFGGYCLPKDTAAMVHNALANGYEPKILQEVVRLNDSMAKLTARKIIAAAKSKDDKIGILGLSFKPKSNDVRSSPAAGIIKELLAEGYANIYAYDPVSSGNFKAHYDFPLEYMATKDDICNMCSVVAIVTIWDEFKGIDKEYPDVQWVDCRYFL